MNYNEAMSYIHEVGNFGSNYGLERTYRILELLGNPQESLKLIHIAGTNGKGSTTSMITSLLRANKFKVGMYTSPFLEEFEERIQINGENIPKDTLARLITKLKVVVDKVIEEGYNHPTEFEIITCLMLLYFKEENVDYGVVEVGLGGRLDSTNVINPILSVITSISFDHTNLLGSTLSEIAREKAGIIKENTPVVIYPQEEEAYIEIEKVSKDINAPLYLINTEECKLLDIIDEEKIYQYISIEFNNEIIKVKLPLLGEHQIVNAQLALKAYEIICEKEKINKDVNIVKDGLKNVTWIGRLEVMDKSPLIVIDGAHNIQGIKALRKNIEKYFKYNNIYLLLGILADKQVSEMIEEITPLAKKVYALTPHSDRAELSSDLRNEIIKINSNCYAYESYEEALNDALKEANEDDLILVSGSLYMIGDMRKIIRGKK